MVFFVSLSSDKLVF